MKALFSFLLILAIHLVIIVWLATINIYLATIYGLFALFVYIENNF